MKSSALFTLVLASLALARPQKLYSRKVGRLEFESFSRGTEYETFGVGVSHPVNKRAEENLEDAVVSYVQTRLNVDPAKISYRGGYTTDTASYGYVNQAHDGVLFANSIAQVSFNKNSNVVAFGSSWVEPVSIAPSKPKISEEDAIEIAKEAFNGQHRDAPVLLRYLVKGDNTAVLVFVVEIQSDEDGSFYEAYVDAATGDLINAVGLTENSRYRVVPYGKVAPPDGFEIVSNPEAPLADVFPAGWHNPFSGAPKATNRGHYAEAAFGISADDRDSEDFIRWIWKPEDDPQSLNNAACVGIQAFYIISKLHDVLYAYGWTEATFNYQYYNFGRGGAELDPIRLYVQSPNTPNNAGFSQRRDGLESQIDLGLFYETAPARDSGFSADFVAHEYGHGLSHRLIEGGGENCLTTLEARGLGEGWSDALAAWTLTKSAEVEDWVFGAWVGNKTQGYRTKPYSTSTETNPLKYSDIGGHERPHPMGEVWANMLHNIYAGLVAEHGWELAARDGDASSTAGNSVFMHLLIDSLQLTPCEPTFIMARDAFIQADQNRYNGSHKCLFWNVFAERGLGVSAKTDRVNNFDKPAECA